MWMVKGKRQNPHNHLDHGDGRKGEIRDPAIEFFKVRMRFPSQTDADAAWAARIHGNISGKYVVTIEVPAVLQDPARNYLTLNPAIDEPPVDPPWEVYVDW